MNSQHHRLTFSDSDSEDITCVLGFGLVGGQKIIITIAWLSCFTAFLTVLAIKYNCVLIPLRINMCAKLVDRNTLPTFNAIFHHLNVFSIPL